MNLKLIPVIILDIQKCYFCVIYGVLNLYRSDKNKLLK